MLGKFLSYGSKPVILLLVLLFPLYATANISLKGTRVIYSAAQKGAKPLTLFNHDDKPSIVQLWVDEAKHVDAVEPAAKVPFIITPPLFRIEGQTEQTVRLIFTGADLPQDRETLYWLNFHQIPPNNQSANEAVGLQFSIINKVKLFYRPTAIVGNIKQLPQQLIFTLARNAANKPILRGHNPSGFYVNFAGKSLLLAEQQIPLGSNNIIAPFSSTEWPLPPGLSASIKQISSTQQSSIVFSLINDQGGSVKVQANLKK